MPFQYPDKDGGKGHDCQKDPQQDACTGPEREGGLHLEEGIDVHGTINTENGKQE